jgi:hypothetical protein
MCKYTSPITRRSLTMPLQALLHCHSRPIICGGGLPEIVLTAADSTAKALKPSSIQQPLWLHTNQPYSTKAVTVPAAAGAHVCPLRKHNMPKQDMLSGWWHDALRQLAQHPSVPSACTNSSPFVAAPRACDNGTGWACVGPTHPRKCCWHMT